MFKELIENHDRRAEILLKIKKHLDMDRKLYIYGAAASAVCVTDYLKEHGIDEDIYYVVDDAYMDRKHAVSTEKIVSFHDFTENYSEDSVLVFGFHDYIRASRIMEEYGDKIPYMYFVQLQEINGELLLWTYDQVMKYIDGFEACYQMLEDNKSRETMVSYVNAAISGDLKLLFEQYREDRQYFNNITNDIKIGTYIDCGAYNGDSIKSFIETFGEYQGIIALEPDPDNYKQICTWRDTEKIKNLKVIEKGVFNETKNLYFSQDATSSYLCENGEICVPVIKLDDLELSDSKVSLIKMDIEGSELAALEGASELIRRDKPSLAVCVYHKVEDLAEIPQYINSLVEKGTYHYYLRHHGDNITELVFYAVSQ